MGAEPVRGAAARGLARRREAELRPREPPPVRRREVGVRVDRVERPEDVAIGRGRRCTVRPPLRREPGRLGACGRLRRLAFALRLAPAQLLDAQERLRPAAGTEQLLQQVVATGAGHARTVDTAASGSRENGLVAPPLTLQGWLRYDVVQRLLATLPDVRSVLEVGAGGGALGARLARRYDYIGVEPDRQSFARASARIPGRVLRELPPRGAYDLLCAFEVLEHLDDDGAALRDLVQRVTPGGHVLLSVPAWPRLFGESDRRVGHRRRYTPEALRSLAVSAGLEVVELRLYAFPSGHVLHAVRDVVARVRPPAGSGGSGRWLQPPERLGGVTWAAALPLRGLQRLFPRRGSSLVLLARRPGQENVIDSEPRRGSAF